MVALVAHKVIRLIGQLLSPPLTGRLYQQAPTALKFLVSSQKEAEKTGILNNEALVAYSEAAMEAFTMVIQETDRHQIELYGNLLMEAGNLAGFPGNKLLKYARQPFLCGSAPVPVNADNYLTIGQIKAIDNRPEWIKGRSKSLNKDIVVVGREAMMDKAKADHGLPVYTAQECLRLKDFSSQMIVAIDTAKEIFDGILLPSKPQVSP